MTNSLREVKDYFNSAMNYIEVSANSKRVPKILYLGNMSLKEVEKAVKIGIKPVVISGSAQELINYVAKNNYTVSSIEDGDGAAYYDPTEAEHFDFVTDGESVLPVLNTRMTRESLGLLVDDNEDNSFFDLAEYRQELIEKLVPTKITTKVKIPAIK